MTVNAGDIVLTTLNEALTIVRRKRALAETNLQSASKKCEALEKAISDYNEQLVLERSESPQRQKK